MFVERVTAAVRPAHPDAVADPAGGRLDGPAVESKARNHRGPRVEQQKPEVGEAKCDTERFARPNFVGTERAKLVDPAEVGVTVVGLVGQVGNADRSSQLRRVMQLEARVSQMRRQCWVHGAWLGCHGGF